MIVPVPPTMLDFLLITNLTFALLTLTLTIYVQQPLKFNAFPSVLLLGTLFRLSLNVATTRQILLNGYGGKVIAAFGNFVVGGNYAVGLVAFIILIVIQFLVITKGAQRIAEVAARFTLDAMPGKQMAIDADLNSGLIDENEARRRRAEIARQADFYGAMDGASKFVRGDAVAGIIITLLNIVGGLIIGTLQLGMSVGDAARTFTLLTIGDGLVAQIPALVISTAAGLLITRSEGQKHLGEELFEQMLGEARAPFAAAGILFLLGLVPALPILPFWLLGALAAGAGLLTRSAKRRQAAQAEAARTARQQVPEKVERILHLDPLELEIGFGLIPLADDAAGGDLLHRVTLTRRQIASDLGFVVPPIRIRDNVRIAADAYVIKLRGEEVARGTLMLGSLLAMGPGAADGDIEGIRVTEPVFGLPALWIAEDQRSDAEMSGLTVVEPASVIATHLTEIVRRHASEILTRQDVQALIDQVKATHPAVVEELIPNLMTVGGVQKVLKRLLAEQVSIRDMVGILEALADSAPTVKDLDGLLERCREALGRSLVRPYKDEKGQLSVATIDPRLEQRLIESVAPGQEGQNRLILDPAGTQSLITQVSDAIQAVLAVAQHPVLICSQYLRPYFHEFIARFVPQVVVLSYGEAGHASGVKTVATIKADELIRKAQPPGAEDAPLSAAG
jgi:flagellar biosynthesis protein FlhA